MNALEKVSDTEVQIIPLIEAGMQAQRVGAKASRLGRLFAAGEQVPDGFCVVGVGPTALAQAVAAYQRLGLNVPVAVRSSASVEDGSEASFAGQFETVLNVRGARALTEAIARCWKSASGARVVAYQDRKARDAAEAPRMAVLVQRMVEARVAGVAFSANPVTGARDEAVIEAARGLGDQVVSGETAPDKFVVAHDGEVVVQAGVPGSPCLTKDEARRVAELVRHIEAEAGTPQDIEWAMDDADLWLLQARPITALSEAVTWVGPVPGAKWMKDFQAGEWAHEPLSPLAATTTFEAMASAREQARGWPPIPKMYQPAHATINGWFYVRGDMRPASLFLNMVGATISILTGNLDGHRRVRRTWPRHLALLESMDGADLSSLSGNALRSHSDRLLGELGWWWMEFCWCTAVPRIGQQLVGQMQVPGLDNPMVLFRGNNSLMLEAQRALRRTAADSAGTDEYLARFGHFVESADPVHPTLRDAPEQLTWQVEAARLGGDPDERLTRIQSERREGEKAVLGFGGFRGFLARRVMTAGQSFAAHADDALFHFQRVLAGLRATFLEHGRRMTAAGVLEVPEDVFYLERKELWRPSADSDLRERVKARRELRERQKRLAPPPFIPPLSDGAWASDPSLKRLPQVLEGMLSRGLQERDGRRVLVGEAVSPGKARGIAKVVAGLSDFERFKQGDILVAHATSPIWTPLLSIAAAAVTEIGGSSSHAAIVSREFGIPLVGGAPDATRVITDGTPIVVDGSTGLVELP